MLNVKVLPNAIFTNHIENCFPRKRHLLFSNLTIGDYPISSWTMDHTQTFSCLSCPRTSHSLCKPSTAPHNYPRLNAYSPSSVLPSHCVKKATDAAMPLMCNTGQFIHWIWTILVFAFNWLVWLYTSGEYIISSLTRIVNFIQRNAQSGAISQLWAAPEFWRSPVYSVPMRKQLDPRIPILINNNVKKSHRSFMVLVGDKGRDQVSINLFPRRVMSWTIASRS